MDHLLEPSGPLGGYSGAGPAVGLSSVVRRPTGSGEMEDGPAPVGRSSHFLSLLLAAIATSIDAAAAGLTLDLFATPVLFSCFVIGLVTALLCAPAYWFASRIGPRFGHFAELLGGVVLIGLGVKILLEHLT